MKKYVLGTLLLFCTFLIGCSREVSTEEQKKILTLAVFQSELQLRNSDLLRWVNLYNAGQEDIQIEIVNYLDNYSDLEEAFNQIKIEINAGKGPDMINFGSQYSPINASCGIMEDLNTFIHSDNNFDEQEYYLNILNSFEVGENLYVMIPSFRINSFTTTNKLFVGMEKMNIHQLVEIYNALEGENILFPGETKKTVFGMICYGSLEDYIDWDAGGCNFDSDSFKEILQFANRFPLYLNISEDYSAKQIFMEGKALLYPVMLDNVYAVTGIRHLYGETPIYIGYPFDSGYGTMAAVNDVAIGISSTSRNKEAAWIFIKSLLDSEYQDNVKNGFPLRINSLEKNLTKAMKTEYDASGEKVVKYQLYFEGEESVEVYEMSSEDAETLRAIICKIEHNSSIDYYLYNILLEEVDYLFYENRDVEEVAKIIQSRVSLYISETK